MRILLSFILAVSFLVFSGISVGQTTGNAKQPSVKLLRVKRKAHRATRHKAQHVNRHRAHQAKS